MARRRFYCEGCGAELSFGASECGECGVEYRYVDGRPVAQGEHDETEDDGEPPALPVPFTYPRAREPATSAFVPSAGLAYALLWALGSSAFVSFFNLTFLLLIAENVLDLGTSLASNDELALVFDTLLKLGTQAMAVLTGVVFLFWIHGATRSARSIAEGLRYTPRAAVFWWFVPLASLVLPYRVMTELWKVSHAPKAERWAAMDTSAVMPCWWAAWLGTILMERLADVNEKAGSPGGTAPIVSLIVRMVAALLAAWIVFTIQRGLERKTREEEESVLE